MLSVCPYLPVLCWKPSLRFRRPQASHWEAQDPARWGATRPWEASQYLTGHTQPQRGHLIGSLQPEGPFQRPDIEFCFFSSSFTLRWMEWNPGFPLSIDAKCHKDLPRDIQFDSEKGVDFVLNYSKA